MKEKLGRVFQRFRRSFEGLKGLRRVLKGLEGF